jgi:hypothetical protein
MIDYKWSGSPIKLDKITFSGAFTHSVAGEDIVALNICYEHLGKMYIADDTTDVKTFIALEDVLENYIGRFLADGYIENEDWSFTPGDPVIINPDGELAEE